MSTQSSDKQALLAQLLKRKGIQLPQKTTIPQRHQTSPCSVSFAQQRLWFLHRLDAEQGTYNVPTALRLIGDLDREALTQSINTIIARHEMLRTRFLSDEQGQPLQVILPHLTLSLAVRDWRELAPSAQDQQVQQLAQAEAERPFALDRPPLIRGTLIQLAETHHVLLVTLHHIICDGWSTGILVRELASLYRADRRGEAASLPKLSLQYADFALWQRQHLTGKTFEDRLAFWREQLADAPSVLELPTDRPRSAHTTNRGARQRRCLSPALAGKLKALSQQSGATLFMTLLAAFKVLLYRYTNQSDLVIGTPIANRDRSELEGLIGFFANTLVLRTRLDPNAPFEEILAQVRQTCLAAYAHQEVPFEKLVEVLQPARNLTHQPLFQVMFAFANTPTEALTLPGLTLESLTVDNPTAKFDLTLFAEDTQQGLQLVVEYNCDLFEAATIERLLGHFQVLLEGIVRRPQTRISDLPLLTPAETKQLLETWNDTQVNYPNCCVHQLVEQQVEKTPHAIAAVFEGETLTYSQLNEQANQLAHYLHSLGVKPDSRVAICLNPSLNLAITVLAIFKAGAAYVPLDPNYPQERLAYMLADTQAPVWVTQQPLLNTLPAYHGTMVDLDANQTNLAQQPSSNPTSGVNPDNLAYIIYTSGSTGKPKGICLSHRALANLLQWHFSTLLTGVRTLQFASLNFDASFHEMFATWGSGGTLYFIDPSLRRNVPELAQFLSQNQIEKVILPVVILHQLAELVANHPQQLNCLREVTSTGEQLQITQAIRDFFEALPSTRLHNHYGPSETHVVTALELSAAPQHWSTHPAIGRPIANTQLYLLDDQLNLVPQGMPGELYIGGVSLAREYLNCPDLTAEKFIASPFSPSKLYKTGDLARYLPNGELDYLGRRDSQVKIRGFRIELAEIETVLLQHEAIQEVLVIAQTSDSGDKFLVAYGVLTPETTLTVSEVRRFLKETLPDYMIPSAFVWRSAFPLTPNGKVDRQALPKPPQQRPDLEDGFVAPRNCLERQLAQIWCEVLEIDRVGVRDNFFELGGHSLLTTRLLTKIQDTFSLTLPLRNFFESPTIAELAARMSEPSLTATSLEETLLADAQLDATIIPPSDSHAPIQEPENIFLTGATGFLGAFLLSDLLEKTSAQLYCLVRADEAEAGMKRLRATLESYHLWQEHFASRLVPVIGDLSQGYLGLSASQFQELAQTIDVIYHNGAWVHHIYSYSVLKGANVLGTQEVLRLACEGSAKPVHFISTLGVFSGAGQTGVQAIAEGESLERGALPSGGYAQTKWVAERLMQTARERGLPVYIYRLGRIAGHQQTGVFNENDFLYRLTIGCIHLGAVPDRGMELDIIPIDYASQSIVHLSRHAAPGQAFHLVNPHPVRSDVLVETIRVCGYPLSTVTYDQWQTQLHQITQQDSEHPLYAIASFFNDSPTEASLPSATLRYDCQNTLHQLRATDLRCPPIDAALLTPYITHLRQQGYIPAPLTPVNS